MTANFSDDLRKAIEHAPDLPLRVIDASSNTAYVIMRLEQYEKVKAIFEPEDLEFHPSEAYPFIDEVMRDDDARDPGLESYQSISK